MRLSMRLGRWLTALLVHGASACTGGQTGEPSHEGDCFEGQPSIVLDGAEARSLGSEWMGQYQATVYWAKTQQISFADPEQVASTLLSVELSRRDQPAREYATCPGQVWIPIQLRAETDDGSVGVQRDAWLWLHDGADYASITAGLDVSGVSLGGRRELGLMLKGDKQLGGQILDGERTGRIGTTCGSGDTQLPLSERAPYSEPALPSPAEALAALDGRRFLVDWGDGRTAELTSRLQHTSTTACWSERGPTAVFATEIALLDRDGANVTLAAASAVMLCKPQEDAPADCSLKLSTNGEVRSITPDEPVPFVEHVDHNDEGTSVFREPAIGISSLAALTGGALQDPSAVFAAQYALILPLSAAQVGPARLEIKLQLSGDAPPSPPTGNPVGAPAPWLEAAGTAAP